MSHTTREQKARRPPRPVLIDGLDEDLVATGLDARGGRWRIRGAPVGATVSAVGRKDTGIRLALLTPADDAVTPACGHFGVCGGCQYQEMSLDRQRQEKHRALAALLEPLGGVDHGIDGVREGSGAPAAYGWRNKLELGVGTERYIAREELGTPSIRTGRWVGLHAPGRYDRIVDLHRCPIVSDAMNAVLARVTADVRAAEWPLWDVHAHTGFFRHIVLREGDPAPDGSPSVLVGLYTTPGDEAHRDWVRSRAPGWQAAGVLWIENDQPADAVQGTLREVVCGVEHLTETIGHVRFRLSPSAFFQANLAGAAVLAEWVAGFARSGPREALWDLYCGTGALGMYCARDFAELIGIDSNAASIADAAANAALNGLDSARFLAGNVEDLVADLPRSPAPTVIVDPPRVGLHPRARAFVAGLDAQTLVYVSCRATSLLRDGLVLREAGWRCTDRVAVDLFPQTAHVEVVSRWERS